MEESDILKEFLVALGFKVDAAQYKKYLDSVQGATTETNKLGLSAAAAIIGTTAAIAKVSEVMEKLYYVSQRTNSSVSSIMAFDYGVSQLGGSSDAAQASLENLAHFIRAYPGSSQFLQQLGVAPEHVKDAEAALRDLIPVLKAMPQYQGLAYANLLGMDEKTFLALTSGKLEQSLDEYNKRVANAGVNMQDAGEKGHDFMVALRGLGSEAEIVGALLEEKLVPSLTKAVSAWDKYLQIGAQTAHDPSLIVKGAKLLGTDPMKWAQNYDETLGLGQKPTDSWQQKSVSERQKYLLDYFKSQGWTANQASGIVAGLQSENDTFDPHRMGDNNHATGLGQWHKDRAAIFKQKYGHDIYSATGAEQAEFVQYELTHNEKSAGDALRNTGNAYDAGNVFRQNYERPANLVSEGARTGALAQQISGNTYSPQTTINVNGSRDPSTVASDVLAGQNDVNKNLIRMSSGVPQ
jgi:hypothetical protein